MYLFHLGNNRLLAEPSAQTQAAGELRSLALVLESLCIGNRGVSLELCPGRFGVPKAQLG